ncbi:cytochrome c [Altererythrobacter sp. CC-YST694]|uniref:c-type cytochrome n=1 Tax=Altererythrobacter sp. CC-YST694 TaxID=2755038 RepID=UPI001D01F586|nr:cytochrome c [Altererythrobacter sp. CC-YST694]MCB5425050.1 cytochrome c [Altererythrobacter sp. CC-YST694]
MKGLIAFAGFALLAAGTAYAVTPAVPAGGDRVAAGEKLFEAKCALCHAKVGTGTMMLARRLGEGDAMLANRRDLDPSYVEAVVRKGIGSMPAITRVEVSDEQLGQIAAYLTRNNPEAK